MPPQKTEVVKDTSRKNRSIFASIQGMKCLSRHLKRMKAYFLPESCLLAVLATLMFNQAQAVDIPDLTRSKIIVPEHIAGVKTLTAEGVVELAMTIPDLIIVDARIRDDRKHGYLEDSVSLPDIETNCSRLEKIIPSKNNPALFYCNGIKCGRSVVSIKIAKSCGYNNMYWFKGGFEEWKNKGYQYAKDR
jgi:rhodanese-related sulfurtransferase